MTKTAKARLLKSDFFLDLKQTIAAWDNYLHTGHTTEADIMMHKWFTAQLALKHITGITYKFWRVDNTYCIINPLDENDILISGISIDHPKIV